MCCKCLYILLVIIIGLLFYIFVPSDYWAEWITAISTCVMAVAAILALDTWKKNIVLNKKISVLTNTDKCIYVFKRFLNDYMRGLYIGENSFLVKTPIDQYLDNTNEQLRLLQSEAEITNFLKLKDELEKLTKYIKSCFVEKVSHDDKYSVYKFEEKYHNNCEFKECLNKHLDNIENICQQEFKKIYN